MSATSTDRLWLADWRRRVAELYEEVRRLAKADPPAAHARWRSAREALYRDHPASPVPPGRRPDFRALCFPYDARLRFELPLLTEDGPPDAHLPEAAAPDAAHPGSRLPLPISTGEAVAFDRIGWLEVPFEEGPQRLAVFWLPEYSGGLFVPFRDATNGRETYGGGRYLLDTAKGADLGSDPGGGQAGGTIVVDLNFAYQPSCAFDPRWSCPLSPPENRLDVAVRSGERIA